MHETSGPMPDASRVAASLLTAIDLPELITSTQLFTRHMEDAYEQMLQRYHKDLAPDHLVVRPL